MACIRSSSACRKKCAASSLRWSASKYAAIATYCSEEENSLPICWLIAAFISLLISMGASGSIAGSLVVGRNPATLGVQCASGGVGEGGTAVSTQRGELSNPV